jgi:hypothetical protein
MRFGDKTRPSSREKIPEKENAICYIYIYIYMARRVSNGTN